MEIEEHTQGQIFIGFPLGLALLVTLLFFICSFFCCCLHWNKLQSLLQSFGIIVINPQNHIQANFASSNHKPGFPVLVISSLSNIHNSIASYLCFRKKIKKSLQFC